MCRNKISPVNWRSPTVLLFLYGLFKELRPSEPYITVFFTEVKNFTQEELTEYIYPAGTYSTMALTVLVFLITDALLYWPVIVLQALSCITFEVFLILGKGIPTMIIVEIIYGLMISCDVAYLTYLYATVPTDQYPKVSALCRVAHLLGRLLSGLVGQTMVSTGILGYLQLHFITVASGCLALFIALSLPAPKGSLYFHRNSEDEASPKKSQWKQILIHFKTDVYSAFSQHYVVAWSVWWAIASCVYYQVLSYVQILWLSQTVEAEDQRWNGYVEAAYTLLGSGASWIAARLVLRDKPWKAWIALAVICTIYAALLISTVFSHRIIVQYALYIAFGTLYFTALTVASSEVAQSISSDSTALIFGVNTFAALVLQSILTAVITANGGLALSIQSQFLVYGSIYGVTAVVFAILTLVYIFRKTDQQNVQADVVQLNQVIS